MVSIAFRPKPDTELYKIENIEWIILAIMFIPCAISIWENPSRRNFIRTMVDFFRLVLDLPLFYLGILVAIGILYLKFGLTFWIFKIDFSIMWITFIAIINIITISFNLLILPIRLVQVIVGSIPWMATFGIIYWIKKSGFRPLEFYSYYCDCLIGLFIDMAEIIILSLENISGIFSDILLFIFDSFLNGY